MRNSLRIAMVLVALVLSASAWAQKPSAYPAKGQGAPTWRCTRSRRPPIRLCGEIRPYGAGGLK